ncbi:MAG: hypothetical protein K6G26_03530, partial [Lachnospiraceae bacterium]|nr:hypothetical protein [Lachnospiraceae bacterium]
NSTEIDDIEKPLFGEGKRGTEESYKNYLESVQSLILEYEENYKIHEIHSNTMKEVFENMSEKIFLNAFKDNFLSANGRIGVKKKSSGKYTVSTNGYHRMYVAKKYGLKLLVYIESIE